MSAKVQVAGQLALPLVPKLPLPMRVTVNQWITRGWRDRAACLGSNDPAFSSEEPTAKEQAQAAQSVCGMCPVRRSCLAVALLNDEQGVWGGTIDGDRETITTKLAGLSAYWARIAPWPLPAACRTEWTPGPGSLDPTEPLPLNRDADTERSAA
ncbi:WhiB family transcriptional regulator [Kribbella speibonae]|uniref:WhiB family transcriptional regulator n=1 Tax=Kribbella speibonae TaxID=1572660 RepID=A0ABY1ZWZ8_9ACTN|nr:WhiB family transcriptional regulator [Kribbella speibonae]TCC19426.1 WhiB family transcriptional regulator [Kribbella speibonae]